ncbi:winged helix-turn-helix transcriptional regulator [Rhodococcus artemisiae]|uniref:Helix-turn-helix domain-containing protein n=1 Tax=Rhodococcus artemisiae TaxID=714159 RepID=A0ABU7LKB2_9NOCA|nr:helix-turn-helix domain-containing protein [Rhodococcus artemisiae]MEE2061347.1 helix-turn-helix domain-containing protein [Rhodococcus artemisiae]
MQWLDYSTDNCSVQRTMNIIGEKWTMIVLREVFNGVRRFEQMRRHTGISEPVLSARLRTLVDAGVLDTVPYQESGHRTRHEYRLTDKGRDLYPILIALLQWGDRYCADPEGPALTVRHHDCGEPIAAVVQCEAGHRVEPRNAHVLPGPGAQRAG